MKHVKSFKVFESHKEFTFRILDHEYGEFTDSEFEKLKSLLNIDIKKSKGTVEKYEKPLYTQHEVDTITGRYNNKVEFDIYKLSPKNEFVLDVKNAASYKCDDFDSLLDLLKEKEYISK